MNNTKWIIQHTLPNNSVKYLYWDLSNGNQVRSGRPFSWHSRIDPNYIGITSNTTEMKINDKFTGERVEFHTEGEALELITKHDIFFSAYRSSIPTEYASPMVGQWIE